MKIIFVNFIEKNFYPGVKKIRQNEISEGCCGLWIYTFS